MRSIYISTALSLVLIPLLFVGCVNQPFVKPIPSVAPQVDAAALEAHVKYLSVDLYPRSYDQLRKTELTVKYIADAMRAAGASVKLQDVKVDELTYTNVVASFGPNSTTGVATSDATATGANSGASSAPLLVIGAHYDSQGDATAGAKVPRGYSLDTHTPGADDNASGVAGLIELARLLGRTPQKRPIELVAYALEEPPYFRTEHMGSVWHAQSLVDAKRNVELMISLEMIGTFNDAPGSQSYPFPGMQHLYSDRGDFIAVVGMMGDFTMSRRVKALMLGASDLPVYSINAPRLIPGIDFSDHRSYWGQGMPAVMVTDTAFMRNKHYHQASDTYEKLDYARMAKVVQGVYAVTQGL
jgi:Zn-dependent M28 family amino/carboxypeptidase